MSPSDEKDYLEQQARTRTLSILFNLRTIFLSALTVLLSVLLALVFLINPEINPSACYTIYGLSPSVDLHATSSFTCKRDSASKLFNSKFDLDEIEDVGEDLPRGHGLDTIKPPEPKKP